MLNATSIGEMEELLESLPLTLPEAFDETLLQIKSLPEPRKQLGLKSLMWILLSRDNRRLRLVDLKEALAVREGQKSTNIRLRPSTEMIISCCRGLVVIDKTTFQPRFIHSAIHDYLQSHKTELFPDGQDLIARTCLTCLLTTPFDGGPCEEERDLQDRITGTAFTWYAAVNWCHHAKSTSNQMLLERSLELLNDHNRSSSIIQISEYIRGRRRLYWSRQEALSYTALHSAASFGSLKATECILGSVGTVVDAMTSIGTTPLMRASSYGYIDIMRRLLEKGADPKKANWYGTSLHIAAEAGQVEAIELILSQSGTDIDMKDKNGRTPLACALTGGHFAAAQALLNHGAESSFELAGVTFDFEN